VEAGQLDLLAIGKKTYLPSKPFGTSEKPPAPEQNSRSEPSTPRSFLIFLGASGTKYAILAIYLNWS
jgi:hypothetical protein